MPIDNSPISEPMIKLLSCFMSTEFLLQVLLQSTNYMHVALKKSARGTSVLSGTIGGKRDISNLVPALRGFRWTGTNWAEIGHSMMKKNRKVWLSVAAAEDIADMIVQENIYLSFIKNEGKTIGKGPTVYTKKMNERKAERYYVNSVVESLRTTDMMDEVEKHKDPDAMFVPSRKAKHRIRKIFSTKNPLQIEKMPVRTANAKMKIVNLKRCIEKYSSEEEEDNDADVEDLSCSSLGDHQQQATIRNEQINTVDYDFNDDGSDDGESQMPPPPQVVKKKVLPDRKNRGKNRKYKYKYHMPTPEEEGNTSDEDHKKSDRRIIPKEVEQRKMASNPPTYVKIFNMVKHCSGCRLLFDDIHRKPPNDLVFQYRMRREYPDPVNRGQWKVADKIGNAYFHSRDLACLHRVQGLERLTLDGIYCEQQIFQSLSLQHLELVEDRGHLRHIRKTRNEMLKKKDV